MSYEKREPEGSVREVWAAANTLRDAVSKVREADPRLNDLGVSVGGHEGSGTTATAARLVITIDADTADHAYEHAKKLEDEGCVCTSSGETQVTCDCSDVE